MHTTPELARRMVDAAIAMCPTLGRKPGVQIPKRVRQITQRLGIDWEDRRAQVAVLHAAGVRLIAGTPSRRRPQASDLHVWHVTSILLEILITRVVSWT
ncbi:MAG TPA: hypothetical protein VIW24_11020 [Aldersonia sp.]